MGACRRFPTQPEYREDYLQTQNFHAASNASADVIPPGQPGSPVLAVAVLGCQPLHKLVHEVAVVHGEAAVDGVQRVRHAQGVHLAPAFPHGASHNGGHMMSGARQGQIKHDHPLKPCTPGTDDRIASQCK